MTQATAALPARRPVPVAVPIRELLPWTVFAALFAAVVIYFVFAEQGAAAVIPGQYVHEFMHDGRHLLGFPCH